MFTRRAFVAGAAAGLAFPGALAQAAPVLPDHFGYHLTACVYHIQQGKVALPAVRCVFVNARLIEKIQRTANPDRTVIDLFGGKWVDFSRRMLAHRDDHDELKRIMMALHNRMRPLPTHLRLGDIGVDWTREIRPGLHARVFETGYPPQYQASLSETLELAV